MSSLEFDEYLDDLIKLVPSDDDSHIPVPEEFSSYQKKSYVPITFFNVDKNIKLLNDCRPLSIKVVDCNQHPWYYKKYTDKSKEQYENECDSDEDDIICISNESDVINMETMRLLNRISSNDLTIERKTSEHSKKKKLKGVDFKRNKGLIGMKVSQIFEIVEVDSDVSLPNNENSNAVIINEFDCNAEENTTKNIKTTSTFNMLPANTESTKDMTTIGPVYDLKGKVQNEGNLPINSDVNSEQELTKDINSNEQTDKPTKELSSLNNKPTDATRKDAFLNSSNVIKSNDIVVNKQSNPQMEHIQKTTCNDGVQIKGTNLGDGPSSSLPCTPPKKNKKFNINRHDTATLEIHQPKNFIDNRFKLNRLISPKNSISPKLGRENVIYTHNNKDEQGKVTAIVVHSKQGATLNEKQENPNDKSNTISKNITNQHELTQTQDVGAHNNVMDEESNPVDKVLDNEQVSEPKIEDNISSAVIKKEDQYDVNNETQVVIADSLTSKICSPVLSTVNNNLTQGNFADKQANESYNIDTNTNRNKFQNTLNSDSKRIFVQPGPSHTSPGSINKRHNSSPKHRIRPFTGSVSNWQNMFNELVKPNTIMQTSDSLLHTLSKNHILGMASSDHQRNITLQNVSSTSSSDISCAQKKTAETIENKIINVVPPDLNAQSLHKTSPVLQNNVKILENRELNSLSKTNAIFNNHLPNVSLMLKQNIPNVSTGHHKLNYCNTPFEKHSQNNVKRLENRELNTFSNDNNRLNNNLLNVSHTLKPNIPNVATGHHKLNYCNPPFIQHSQNNYKLLENRELNTFSKNNDRLNNNLPNATHIFKQNIPNVATGHNKLNYRNPPFEQSQQFVRPVMKYNDMRLMDIRNYSRPMYTNNINPNSATLNPYGVGYPYNHNLYFPYNIYPSIPPPPPPPPPPPLPAENSRDNSNVLHTSDIVVGTDTTNKVRVLKQIRRGDTFPHPAYRQLPSNYTNKPNVMDSNINNLSSLKTRNVASVNSSPNVVSSKIEMFQELEKEMMNIHNEDSQYFLQKDLVGCILPKEHNNIIKDKHCINSKLEQLPTNEISKNTTKNQSKEHNSSKTSQNLKPAKRPSSETVSKVDIKKKKDANYVSEKFSSSVSSTDKIQNPGYSPPILPIPSFQKTLEIITRASNDAKKCFESKAKCRKQMINGHLQKDQIKKISFKEYKHRGEKPMCERQKQKYEMKKAEKSLKRCVETKHSDHDQGYDSETTVLL